MKNIFLLVANVLTALCSGYAALAQQDSLSAQAILQRAIDSEGGDRLLDSINAMDHVEMMITAKKDTIYLAIKRSGFNKFLASALSITHENSTTIYNNGRAVLIKNELAQAIVDPVQLEALQLNCYLSRNFAYKKLGYRLIRGPDETFDRFDCYVLLVESPLGEETINYYDKKDGHLQMIVYENKRRTVFMEWYKQRGISMPKSTLEGEAVSFGRSYLTRVDDDAIIDSNWFRLPAEGVFKAPAQFTTGTFNCLYENKGFTLVRTKDRQTEIKDNTQTEYYLKWESSTGYLVFRLKNPAAPPDNSNIEYNKCRIINWSGSRAYFHCIGPMDGTKVIEKVQ